MSKLTLDELLKELGRVTADDLEGEANALKMRQVEETTQQAKRHQAERKAIEDRVIEMDRRTVELREAIKLARDGMDPLLALMQTKGNAFLVLVGAGPSTMWVYAGS